MANWFPAKYYRLRCYNLLLWAAVYRLDWSGAYTLVIKYITVDSCSNTWFVFSVGSIWTRRTSSSVRWRRHTTSCWWRLRHSTASRRRTKIIGAACRSTAGAAVAAAAVWHQRTTGNSRRRSYSIDMIDFSPDLPTLGFVQVRLFRRNYTLFPKY